MKYDVIFNYEELSRTIICNNIEIIEQNASQWYTVSGEEIMSFRYDLTKPFHLRSSDSIYVVSPKGLIGIEITKA